MSGDTKICVVTGTRAEFGLLSPLMKAIQEHDKFELQIVVTGMHLSPEFGNTYQQIEEAGFRIDEKVEMLLSADTDTAIVKSTGLGMIGYADALGRLEPHWLLLLGDRFETFAAATAAYLKKIPIIHLHGGEVTSGATDEALRHSITKMATLHFTATEEYRTRVLQLGERDDQVFNVGAIGLDNVYDLPLLSQQQLEETLGIQLMQPLFLVTYHPVTLEENSSASQMQALLDAFDALGRGQVVLTMPNADANGRIIIELINRYANANSPKAVAFTSLGQLRYLSLMKYATAVVGNSSSGILEGPSFGIPTVNIGDRQKGRIAAASVIHCTPDRQSIFNALQQTLDPDFRKLCQTIVNPYGNGGTTQRIVQIMEGKLQETNLKKEFVDRI